ncbi:conserved hypothetical protein [Candidatus Methylobacter favarea]|uniref:Uncharacterized protein n=1 Tax=Candidatus Methylobacter favarea TaxID=2707345 RepID=A0A8S0WKT0_9GAMM|nr:hypothetical protein [Candidatus Methylobacter favarea]CAA9892190.1 conserved hypothetical protein [Candidatus Methylobacter favarea]
MSEIQKIMIAVVGIFVIGIIMVGTNKEQSIEEKESASKIRNYVALQNMANQKCPAAIKQATGEQVYFPLETNSDKETYITMKWAGEQGGFKTASCTVRSALGGISELIIDDNILINKKI